MRSEGQTVRGKIYAAGPLLRYEMGPAVTITRLDRKKSYVLMPDQKMYMEHPIDPLAEVKAGTVDEGDVARASIGSEDVDGNPAEKFKVTYTGSEGAMTFYQWTHRNGLQVKVEAEDGAWSVLYQNIVVGAQEASLFEVPSDYQLFAMPDISRMMQMNAEDLQLGEAGQ